MPSSTGNEFRVESALLAVPLPIVYLAEESNGKENQRRKKTTSSKNAIMLEEVS